jgi:colanic acid biosynthesis glycosyl transferase WcaI
VQDFEVNAFFGLMHSGGGLFKRIILFFERILLRGFDKVSTISDGMIKLAEAKGVEGQNVLKLPNWSEIQRFESVDRDKKILTSFGIDPAKNIVLYSGNMGEKQGLELVIKAAQHFRAATNIHFLLVGDGAEKQRLESMAETYDLENVTFAPLQPYVDLPLLLASADCHLVLQKRLPNEAFFPSKLTNILAVGGNSVISADNDTSLSKLCRDYPGIAKCVEPESLSALIDGIEAVLTWPKTNDVARNYARSNLDKDAVLARFIRDLESLESD